MDGVVVAGRVRMETGTVQHRLRLRSRRAVRVLYLESHQQCRCAWYASHRITLLRYTSQVLLTAMLPSFQPELKQAMAPFLPARLSSAGHGSLKPRLPQARGPLGRRAEGKEPWPA